MANIYAYQPDIVKPNFKPFQANLDLELKVLLHTQQKYDEAYTAISNLKKKALNINFWNKGEQSKIDAINNSISESFKSKGDLGDLSKGNIANKWTGMFNQFNTNPNLANNYRRDKKYQEEYQKVLSKKNTKNPEKEGFHNINFSNYMRRVNEYVNTDLDSDKNYQMKGYTNYIDYETKLREIAKDIPEEEWFEEKIVSPGVKQIVHHKGKNPKAMAELMSSYLSSDAISQLKEESEYHYHNNKDVPGFKNKILGEYYGKAEQQLSQLKKEKTDLIRLKGETSNTKELESIDARVAELNHSIIKSTPSEDISDDSLMSYMTSAHLQDVAGDYSGALGGYTTSVEQKPDEVFFKTKNLELAFEKFSFQMADSNRNFGLKSSVQQYNIAKDQRDFNYKVAKDGADLSLRQKKLDFDIAKETLDGKINADGTVGNKQGALAGYTPVGSTQAIGEVREARMKMANQANREAKINHATKGNILKDGLPGSMRFEGEANNVNKEYSPLYNRLQELEEEYNVESSLLPTLRGFSGVRNIVWDENSDISSRQDFSKYDEMLELQSQMKTLKSSGQVKKDLSSEEITSTLARNPDAYANDYEIMQQPLVVGYIEAMDMLTKSVTPADIPALIAKAEELVNTPGTDAYEQAIKRRDIGSGLEGMLQQFPQLSDVQAGPDGDLSKAIAEKWVELTKDKVDDVEFMSQWTMRFDTDGLTSKNKEAVAIQRNKAAVQINSNLNPVNEAGYLSDIPAKSILAQTPDLNTGIVSLRIDPTKLELDDNGLANVKIKGETIVLGMGRENIVTYHDPSMQNYDMMKNFFSRYSASNGGNHRGINYSVKKISSKNGQERYRVIIDDKFIRDKDGKAVVFNSTQVDKKVIRQYIDQTLDNAGE